MLWWGFSRRKGACSSPTKLFSGATVSPPEIRVRCPAKEARKRSKQDARRRNSKKDKKSWKKVLTRSNALGDNSFIGWGENNSQRSRQSSQRNCEGKEAKLRSQKITLRLTSQTYLTKLWLNRRYSKWQTQLHTTFQRSWSQTATSLSPLLTFLTKQWLRQTSKPNTVAALCFDNLLSTCPQCCRAQWYEWSVKQSFVLATHPSTLNLNLSTVSSLLKLSPPKSIKWTQF